MLIRKQKHTSLYPKGYVDRLQKRISQVEALLHKIKPDLVVSEDGRDMVVTEIPRSEDHSEGDSSVDEEESDLEYLLPPALSSLSLDSSEGSDSAHDNAHDSGDDDVPQELCRILSRLSSEMDSDSPHFFGDSSPLFILKNVLETRESTGLPTLSSTANPVEKGQPCRCPLLCRIHPWPPSTKDTSPTRDFNFPPLDLMNSLVELYFTFYNSYLPVLHYQTFMQAINVRLHLHDDGFGAVALLVCALGSKASDDPRVLLEDHMSDGWHSAGWKWFRQVDLGEKALFSSATLHDLQIACLSAIYLRNTSSPDSSHICTGLGLRLAQNMGADRRRSYYGMQQIDQELLKRVFWVLVYLDWSYSPSVGRPSSIRREDIDLDLPLQCDDEYWIHADPRVAFRQPLGVPSKVAFFNCLLRLSQINIFAFRTLYSSTRVRTAMKNSNPEWERRAVAELDTALVHWFREVPLHLQWDPHNPSIIFLSQSATLHAAYYALQIAIHRPFIPHPLKSTEASSVSSLMICMTAAKGCVRVLDKLSQRSTPLLATVICDNVISLFVAGIVLLIGVWREKEIKASNASIEGELADLQRVKEMLNTTESRWHSAGRIWDMLRAVATVGEIPTSPLMPSSYKEHLASGEQALEEVWLRSRLPKHFGKRLAERSLIYHHPIVSGIAAVEEGSRAPLPSPYNPHLGISPAVTLNRLSARSKGFNPGSTCCLQMQAQSNNINFSDAPIWSRVAGDAVTGEVHLNFLNFQRVPTEDVRDELRGTIFAYVSLVWLLSLPLNHPGFAGM
ncbi:hypothetical protein NM688_g6577 [Phlebia brevispora]|uniref:Uncharacterized protein n=1 Tax=Phlebia brevispora TaxID=194682 RepID=A0ACC1SEM0_9APHY|nr:hypothetical protein NM688_g6577 [Phlebia brevispora]